MDKIMEKIDAYFDNVSDEQFTKDILEAGFIVKCKKHPKYAIKQKPTSNCETCLLLWNAKNQ